MSHSVGENMKTLVKKQKMRWFGHLGYPGTLLSRGVRPTSQG